MHAHRGRDDVADPLTQIAQLLLALDGLAEHAELVATEPGDEIAGAYPDAKAATELNQHAVARVVPERVVDLLEAVEIEEQHPGDGAVTRRSPESLLAHLEEHRPVGQARERVVARLVLEAMLGALQLGDVVGDRRDQHELSVLTVRL